MWLLVRVLLVLLSLVFFTILLLLEKRICWFWVVYFYFRRISYFIVMYLYFFSSLFILAVLYPVCATLVVNKRIHRYKASSFWPPNVSTVGTQFDVDMQRTQASKAVCTVVWKSRHVLLTTANVFQQTERIKKQVPPLQCVAASTHALI